MSEEKRGTVAASRLYAFLVLFALGAVALTARAVHLQVLDTETFQREGENRHLRTIEIPATRGIIADRNGEPLAVSTPVDSVWLNPTDLYEQVDPAGAREVIATLAEKLDVKADDLERKVMQNASVGQQFIWIRRRINPSLAREIEALGLPSLGLRKEYRRFYPAGEVAAHLIGFTDVDDTGKEGLELAFDDWLQGVPGKKRIIRNARGETVEEIELVREAEPGKDLPLTIDRRLQHLAYRELTRTVLEHGALSGSVVLMDVKTGEVLAVVNQPSYNPNHPAGVGEGLRNRALTDLFEPGSVMKPLAVASALENGVVTANTMINTHPGTYQLGRYTIRDHHDYGILDVTGVITKSSNVGAIKVTRDLEPEQLWGTYDRLGFGEPTGTGFPGESAGVLRSPTRWRDVDKATVSYGYGINVTVLQLAQAYAALANGGKLVRPTLIRGAANPPVSVMDPGVARRVVAMLETVTGEAGTGKQARVPNYRVAGKTGTSRMQGKNGYAAARYIASFAGFAPVSDPRLVCVVVIHDPTGDAYYGGLVAAPLFSRVMDGALRLLNVPPDAYPALLARQEAETAQPLAEEAGG